MLKQGSGKFLHSCFRISMKNMRKSRFFQNDAYISVDFLEKETEIIRLKDIDKDKVTDPFAMIIDLGKDKGAKQIFFDKPEIKEINAIKTELQSFLEAIIYNKTPLVTINDGYNALNIALTIIEKLNILPDNL